MGRVEGGAAASWGGDLRAELSACRRLFGARLRGQMQYKISFLLQLGASALLHGSELLTLFFLFANFETLGGWTAGEVAFLYGISSISFGLAHTVASGLTGFEAQVRRGDFDRILTRPLGAFLQVLTTDLQLRRLGGVIQGFVALGIAARLTDIAWTPGRALYLPVAILCATALFVALFTLDAAFCFWTTEGTEAVNAVTYGGSQLAVYPLHIFDAWLRRFFLWLIPLGFVVYAPALYFLDKPTPLDLPDWSRFMAPVAALAFSLVASGLWRIGVRRYRSTGS